MALLGEEGREQLAHLRRVLDHEDPLRPDRRGRGRDDARGRRRDRRREADGDGGPAPERALDREVTRVPLDHAVAHAEAEPRALDALGREERLARAVSHLVGHPDARVRDRERDHASLAPGGERDAAAFRKRVDGVEHEVHDRLAERHRIAVHDRDLAALEGHAELHPLGLRDVVPPHPRPLEHLGRELVEVDALEPAHGLGLGEALEPAHDVGGVPRRALDDLQRAPPCLGLLVPQQELHAAVDDREEVVQVVGRPARELPERAQGLAADHALLRGLEVLEGPLRLRVQARVVEGQDRVRRDALDEPELLRRDAAGLVPPVG